MKTAEEYVASLRKMKWRAYFFGQRIENPVDFEIIKPSQNSVALTYQLAHETQYSPLMTATSHLTGKKINRFTHIPQNCEDLVKKVKMLRLLGQKTGSCFQRCAGLDALITLSSITYDLDKRYGTRYRANYNSLLEYVQNEDLVCNAAMTDVKGDRSLRPSQQADPDLYLRIVKRNENGIIVRGAKAHQTGALNAHEIVVMPTVAMDEDEKDYAVSFAIPSDSEGLIHFIGRQANDTRKLEGGTIDVGNLTFGVSGHEALVVFDNVFIPMDRILMCG